MSTPYIREDNPTTGHPALHLLPPVCIPSMAPYFIRNLIPRRQAHDENRKPLLEVILSLTGVQWAQFLTGYDTFLSRPLPKTDAGIRWLAWTCDAIDFFNVALSVTRLQVQFHKAEAASIVRHD